MFLHLVLGSEIPYLSMTLKIIIVARMQPNNVNHVSLI